MKNCDYKLFAYTCLDDRVWFDKPRWLDIEEWFDRVFQKGGSIVIELQDPTPGRVSKLALRGEEHKFLLIATIYGEAGDRVIRWRDPEGTPERGTIDIAGDEWDARSVLSDLSIAVRVFREVFETGELSQDALSHMR